MELFAEFGFGSTTMKDVAARAEISPRGLIHHFPTKEDLLLGALEMHEARYTDHVPQAGNADSIATLIVDTLANPRVTVELHATLSAEATSRHHPAHEHYLERYSALRGYLELGFTELEKQGKITPRSTPGELAVMLIAVLDGAQLQWLYSPETIDLAAVVSGFFREIGFQDDIAGVV